MRKRTRGGMEWLLALLLFWSTNDLGKGHPFSNDNLKLTTKDPFEIVYPVFHPATHRKKRSANSVEDHPLVVLRTSKDTFYIKLEPVEGLFRKKRSPHDVVRALDDVGCHYRGTLLSHDPKRSAAAISICGPENKMSGVVMTDSGAFVLRPLDHVDVSSESNNHLGNMTNAHVIVKIDHRAGEYCGADLKEAPVEEEKSHWRERRSPTDGGRKVIEVAVYVDHPLNEKLGKKSGQPLRFVQDTVLAILNEVQLIYNYQSLKTKFKIVVVKLEILSEGKEGPDAAEGDIDLYLDNFCSWQALQNPPVSSEQHWDHALMLSGYDLHKVILGNEKNKKVLGLAWVNGMCRPKHSCTLNEGSSFEAAFVIAHEMGHSLGMMHDGRGNDCDPSSYLMSEKTGPGRITWSPCSNLYLDRFFQKGYGSCLEDDSEYLLDSVDYRYDAKLPGQRFDIAQQCKLSLGEGFKPHHGPKPPFNDVCRELWCVSGLWASVAHPALEGSTCATGKSCIQGQCVDDSGVTTAPSNAEIVEDLKGAVTEFLDKLKVAFHLLDP